ncbi:Phage-related lysozyme (muraminidase) [Leminorella richardii]|uniref:Lysozyme n=1 Tax=Leminorella richardii TaxID=158841 RepID=A0A2X4Y0R8_9GAMM|nr:lysozyme [Leminorella richardii]SQI42344.1 Phage-related lysozyme (muraminidase) [Leminorella richardii]
MMISQQGVDLIKSFESCRLKAYLCPAGVWTIGYGHTSGVRPNDEISQAQAERYLKADLVRVEQDVRILARVPLTQGQFDALVSFAFNCGTRALSTSTLLRKLNGRDYVGAAEEFSRWVFANGKRFAGLERRRRLEKRMFES